MIMYPQGITNIKGKKKEMDDALRICSTMRMLGHAVEGEEIFDSVGNFISGRIHHYRTCRACAEKKVEVRSA